MTLLAKITYPILATTMVAGAVVAAPAAVAVEQPAPRAVSDISLSFAPIASGFSSPTAVTSAPHGGGRLFVVERAGLIKAVSAAGAVQAKPYLDIRSRVNSSSGEQGLLGLAFSPNFAKNRLLFFTYTNGSGALVVARAKAKKANSSSVAGRTVKTLFKIAHPTYTNHNGGAITFTKNGLLLVGTGDGGSGGDPNRNAQRLTSDLGKLLRVDVNRKCGKRLFCIPAKNPYRKSANKTKRMVWAHGLRNPWRVTTDLTTGNIWIGDVGQDKYEEIDVVRQNRKAPDFGWSCEEGHQNYNPDQCRLAKSTIKPVVILCQDFPQAGCAGKGQSITGGYVYRGSPAKSAYGAYIFADFLAGGVYAHRDGQTAQVATRSMLTSFGETQAKELVAVSYTGTLFAVNSN